MNLIFATHNLHKLEEARLCLGRDVRITSLDDVGWVKEISETESTLLGNALLKVSTIYKATGQACFSDDTGLEIEALEGKPGVFTARFAGENATAQQNRNKTLRLLHGESNRRAVFRTVIALILNGQEYSFEGQVFGHIAERECGVGGFGYDPIFIPEGHAGTYAELPLELKSKMSHRALALQQMKEFLSSLNPSPVEVQT